MLNTTSPFFDRIRLAGQPSANPASIVACGNARFSLLTARLVRLEWAENGQFEDRATLAFPTRYGAAPIFYSQHENGGLTIRTDHLTIRYVEDGRPFHAGNLSITLTVNGKAVTWTPGTANPGNLRGTRRTLDQFADAVNLDAGLLSRDGWTLFDDSHSFVWNREQVWVEGRDDSHLQDWYFFGYGHDYKTLLSEYVRFGGAIPLVPRYVLGLWWSRFWAYHADDLKALVNDFAAHDIPLDVLVVDMDWHTPDGWTGYTWNRELFPDPEGFLAWVHDQKLHATLNLHPAQGVQKHEAAYAAFSRLLGRDPALGDGIAFDSADQAFVQHYFELLHHPMEEQGVDFWWLDWQQGSDSTIKNLDPLPWLNHLHFQDSARRGTRPMLYSRWGGLGNHRYPIGFSGDAYTTWESLAFQPYFTATAANVCFGWWSHDIGGHFGAADPELYARWVQFGALSPCLRLHSTKDPLAERRPWGFNDDVYAAAKAAIHFRYQLLPYLNSAARAASQIGLSLCYPLYYEYPSADDAYLARGQYFLGDQLIAAPIVTPADPQTGLATFDVWIPQGEWFEFTTLERFCGPRWLRLEGDLMRMPLFAKAGAIVPLSPPIKRTQDYDGSQVILTLFPGADGTFELYEDDDRGAYELTRIALSASDGETIALSIAPSTGDCPTLPAERTFELRLRAVKQPKQVTWNSADHTDWTYNAATQTVTILTGSVSRKAALEFLVAAERAAAEDAQPTAPFVHGIDYTAFDDVRQQLGTVIVVPPGDDSPFNVEIVWTREKDGQTTTTAPMLLKDCTHEQIFHSPFHDEGDFQAFRWSVRVHIRWQGQNIPFHYQSKVAYPAITQWQAAIYHPQQPPLELSAVTTGDGELNPALAWQDAGQRTCENIRQPYGVVLLEAERERIVAHEPLEACVTATITRATPQEAVLHFQHVGEARCYLNGVELQPTDPVAHETLSPMFYSWMPPQQVYYPLPLKAGENRLVVITRPDESIGWWGVGGTVYDRSGKVII